MDIKGVFTKEIADVSIVPTSVSLAGNANFIEFEGKKEITKSLEIDVHGTGIIGNLGVDFINENITYCLLRDKETGNTYSFRGIRITEDPPKESIDYEYDLNFEDLSIENTIKEFVEALKRCSFLNDNYTIAASPITQKIYIADKILSVDRLQFTTFNPDFFTTDYTNKALIYSLQITDTTDNCIFRFNDGKDTYDIRGTLKPEETNNGIFFIDGAQIQNTVNNFCECLKKNIYINNNFTLSIPPLVDKDNTISNGNTIILKPKNIDKSRILDILSFNFGSFQTEVINKEAGKDILLNGDIDCQIELDVYTDTGIRLGEHDIDENKTILGTYFTTQTKAYSGQPIWFDLNSVPNNIRIHSNQLPENGLWSNPETVRDFRYIAKRNNGYNRETFFVSDVFYAVNGHCRSLDENNLDEYIYDPTKGEEAKLLTKQPSLFHIKGQVQFLNFLLSKPKGFEDDTIGVMYHLKSQSGAYIAREECHKEKLRNLNSINSIRLDIDTLLDKWEDKGKTTGQVEIYLARNGERMSQSINFTILPDYLYKINDFAFLNSLGGWNSFNFAGTNQTEFKSKASTISKTQTPKSSPKEMLRSEIESVFAREVEEYFTAQTMPINAATAEWLKEMSASTAVYEISSDRYIIVDDMDIKHSSKDDLVTVQMKYHYSDSYN